ncbi:MAG: zf-HC2 domain-containing protein [Acidimicrobiia bacterium]
MTCDQIREAISARLDGEDPGVPLAELDAHLASCGPCRAFAEGVGALHRSLRLAPAPDVPDLTPQVVAAIGAEPADTDRARDSGRVLALRLVLAVLGLVQVAVAVPALFGGDSGLEVHSARHLGSFSLALAVGFLFAAWRPSRVAGLLPVAAALVACLVGTSVLDVAGGHTAALGEVSHVTEVAGLVAVWLLAHPAIPTRPTVAAA